MKSDSPESLSGFKTKIEKQMRNGPWGKTRELGRDVPTIIHNTTIVDAGGAGIEGTTERDQTHVLP